MEENKEETHLIGYWNGSLENPEITFNINLSENKIMSYITIKPVPLPRQNESVYDIKANIQKTNKISNEIKKLMESTKRLK